MGVIVGSLAGQNWHRQANMRGLEGRPRFEYVLDKTVDIARRFGFRPMGIDIGLTLIGTDAGYLDELRARLEEGGLRPTVGIGQIAVTNDAWVRARSLTQARANLEAATRLGARTGTFSCARNGRVTRAGQLRRAGEMLAEVGPIAADLGLRICQENFDYFTSTELIAITRASGSDSVGIQSDTGNWLILGEDPVTATRACLPHTFHAHVRDYVLENETYNGVAVGAGLVDFAGVLPLLAEAGRREDLVFSIEVDTDDRDEDECAEASFAFIKRWLIENGHREGLVDGGRG